MFMKEIRKYYQRRIIVIAVIIFLSIMFGLPLILHIPFIKQAVSWLLSFTENEAFKAAYVEFFGAIIGSFIAIYGSVWIQGKVDEKEETDKRKKYACIVYNDLDLAFKDLIKIYRDTELRYHLKTINNEENMKIFCEVAVGRKIHLSPNWISDVAQLNDVLDRNDIKNIYIYYGKLLDIDRALQSGKTSEIQNIFSSHIEYLVCGNQRKPQNYCESILNKLSSLM